MEKAGQFLRGLIDRVKRDILTLWYVVKHPKTPWRPKVFAGLLCAYAWSPWDIIPDFIPLLGYLDEVIILPIGLFIVFRCLPEEVLLDCKEKTKCHEQDDLSPPPKSHMGLIIVMIVWAVILAAVIATVGISKETP